MKGALLWIVHHPLLTAAIATLVVAGLNASLKFAAEWIVTVCTVTLRVQKDHHGYSALAEWVEKNTSHRNKSSITIKVGTRNDRCMYIPIMDSGKCLLVWNKRPVWVINSLEKDNEDETSIPQIKLRMIGFSANVFDALLEELSQDLAGIRSYIRVYQNQGKEWKSSRFKDKRNMDSVIIDPQLRDLLVNELNDFNQKSKRYEKLSIPYQRGYLLHGSPGTGKSSLLFSLASHFDRDIYYLSLSGKFLEDGDLSTLASSIPCRAFLVIEDIDSIFVGRKSVIKESQLTFSGLLNALDGLFGSDGRILFLTANHPEKLDPALTRPGRIDRKIEVPCPGLPQVKEMFLRFGVIDEEEAEAFATANPDVSMAAVQEHLLRREDITI
jgi:SpoVK/Ycf46/Vps4 family AAA+-type ATPase